MHASLSGVQEQEFEDRVFDILARARSEADVASGFDARLIELEGGAVEV